MTVLDKNIGVDIELAFPQAIRTRMHDRSAAAAEKGAVNTALGPKASSPSLNGKRWITVSGGLRILVNDDGRGSPDHELAVSHFSGIAQKASDYVSRQKQAGQSVTAAELVNASKQNRNASDAHRDSAKLTTGGVKAAHTKMADQYGMRAGKHMEQAIATANISSKNANDATDWIVKKSKEVVGEEGIPKRAKLLEDAHGRAEILHRKAAADQRAVGNLDKANEHDATADEHKASRFEQQGHIRGLAQASSFMPYENASRRAHESSVDIVKRAKWNSPKLNKDAAEAHQKTLDEITSAALRRATYTPEKQQRLDIDGNYHAGMRDAHRVLSKVARTPEEATKARDYITKQIAARNKAVALNLDFPVDDLSLAADEGNWITVNGTHILIKNGAGSKKEQVASFLSKHAQGASHQANTDGKIESHAAAAKANHEAAVHNNSPEHAATAQHHANQVSNLAHHASATAYDHVKDAVKAKARAVKDVIDRIRGMPKAAYNHVKSAIKSKADDIKDAVHAKYAGIASKLHSVAANYHQIASDVHGLLGNKEKASEHAYQADKHVSERDANNKVVMDHRIKIGDNSPEVRAEHLSRLHGISLEDAKDMVKRADAGEKPTAKDQQILNKHAKGSSEEAESASEKAEKSGKPEHHGEASDAHGKAAKDNDEAGHKDKKEEHERKQHYHHERSGGGGGGRVSSGGGMRSSSSYGGSHKKKTKTGTIHKLNKHLHLSFEDATDGAYMLFPGLGTEFIELGEQRTADGKPIKRFRKEIIREGDFQKQRDGISFSVTPKSLEHWVCTFDEMKKNGVKVYFPAGHTNKPEANRGYWEKFEIGPSSKDPSKKALYGEVEAVGDDGIGLIGRSDVSLYSPPELVDGEGHVYKRPIVHVAACSDPVIPHLGPWEAIAASLFPVDMELSVSGFAGTPDANTLIADPGTGEVNKKALQAKMQGLKQGDTIYGVFKRWGKADTRTEEQMHYEGKVESVTDHQWENLPSETIGIITTVIYKDGDNDFHTVSCFEPHASFRVMTSEVVPESALPLPTTPTQLSLDDDPDKKVGDFLKGEADSEDSSDSSSEDSSDSSEDSSDDSSESSSESSSEDSEDSDDDTNKKKKSLSLSDGPTKSENGKEFPKSDYAYTPSNNVSEWKLRLTSVPGGEPDAAIVGAATAALGKGFRGNKVSLPDGARDSVIAKVRAAWKKANSDKDDSDMPDVLKLNHSNEGEETMQVGTILEKLGVTDFNKVTAENCESIILSAIDKLIESTSNQTSQEDLELAITARVEAEMEQRYQYKLENEKKAFTLSLGGHEPSEIEVDLKSENLSLRLSNLIDAQRLTPAAAGRIQKEFLEPEALTLSLSRGDDTLDKMLKIIADNDVISFKEETGGQSKGAVRLSRKSGKPVAVAKDDDEEGDDDTNAVVNDADRRKAEWDAKQAKSKAAR